MIEHALVRLTRLLIVGKGTCVGGAVTIALCDDDGISVGNDVATALCVGTGAVVI